MGTDASWELRQATAALARRELAARCATAGTVAVAGVRDACIGWLEVLAELEAALRADPARWAALGEETRDGVHTRLAWAEGLDAADAAGFLAALWQGWSGGRVEDSTVTAFAEWRVQLLELFREGAQRAMLEGHSADAARLSQRGLAHAEAFLQAGETAAGVRAETLWLYSFAGAQAKGDPATTGAAQAFYDRGLDLAETFLQAGESAAGVREATLELYHDASKLAATYPAGAGEERNSLARGLEHAETFLQAGETSSAVRGLTLALYLSRGFVSGRFADLPSVGDELYATELNVGRRTEADRATAEEVLAFYDCGLEHAEAFLQAGETSAEVRVLTLMLYSNACVQAGWDPIGTGELRNFLARGLEHAEAFLQAGEISVGVCRQILFLLHFAREKNSLGSLEGSNWRQHQMLQLVGWVWSWFRDLDLPALRARSLETNPFITPWMDDESLLRFETQWLDLIQTWLLRYSSPRLAHLPQDTRALLRHSAEALLLYRQAQDNDEFRTLFEALVAWQRPRETAWARSAQAMAAARAALDAAVGGQGVTDTDPVGFTERWLADQAWWRRWHPAQRRVRRALAQVRAQLAAAPSLDDAAWRTLQRTQRALIEWLVRGMHRKLALPTVVEGPAPALLAILLAGQPEAPELTVARWETRLPWSDPEALDACLQATQWVTWLQRFDAGEGPTLYAWSRIQAQAWRLQLAEDSQTHLTLAAALRAYASGDPTTLTALLQTGWEQARNRALLLAHLLDRWARLGADEALDLATLARDPSWPDEEAVRHTAVAAVILGDVTAVLRTAVAAWLQRHWPLTREADLNTILSTVKVRFGQVLARHPGPTLPSALAKRLHDWRGEALADSLAEEKPNLASVWDHLEGARLALTGLTLVPPETTWRLETAKILIDQMQQTWTTLPTPGHLWPPLKEWLTRLAQCLPPPRHTVAACQSRLGADEALIQLYFAPEARGAALEALWLPPSGPLERRVLPAEAASPGWETGPLAAWRTWAEEGEYASDFASAWTSFATSPAVQAVIRTLAAWARAAQVRHLVLLFPAVLGQFPWEALLGDDLRDLTLERPVSLRHWRRPPQASGNEVTLAHGGPTQGIAYGEHELSAAAAFWNTPPDPPTVPTHAFDLMARLSLHAHAHLVLHGHYAATDPGASYLQLAGAERLFAWTFSALAPGGQMGLSACQSALSGRAAEDWLGPVGLGPVWIAAGARRLTGTLWRCDQLAAWFFHQELYALATACPDQTWSQVVAAARARLRTLTGEEVETRLRTALGEDAFRTEKARYTKYINPDRPFANPYYWAPFVLLGDDGSPQNSEEIVR